MRSTRRDMLGLGLIMTTGLEFGGWPPDAAAAGGSRPWEALDRASLDRAYNNSAAVPESAEIFKGWSARSAQLRSLHPEHLDLAYGPLARQKFDFFAAGKGSPVLVFIHGGYWQARSKDDFSFLAEHFLAAGISVAMVGYPLGPDASMDEIVASARTAVRTIAGQASALGGDPRRLMISGWSSGGHLATMALNEVPSLGGLAISGIYELEPLIGSYLNDKLHLDLAVAKRNSPILHLPGTSAPLAMYAGSAELSELRRQSAEYAAARREAGLAVEFQEIAGANHYTILNSLLEPSGTIHGKIRSQLLAA